MIQRASEGFKYGNPPDHEQAVHNVKNFLIKNAQGEWVYWPEWEEKFYQQFCFINKLRLDYSHNYDLAVTTTFNINRPFLFIEIDGEKHSKKQQKINDGIAEKYVKEWLYRDIIRLNKTECLGEPKDRDKYLSKQLEKYIR